MQTRTRGFTLIELMLVVAIIGIMAAIAIPGYARFACRAKQTEAKAVLKQVLVAEEAYRGEADTYMYDPPANLIIIGVIVTGRARYTYSVPLAPPNTFTALATALPGSGMDGPPVDQWSMDESGVLINTVPLCDSL